MKLPRAPQGHEVLLFADTRRWIFYLFSFLSVASLITGNFLFIGSHVGFLPYAIFIAALIGYLGISFLIGVTGEDFDYLRHRIWVSNFLIKGESPSVDIYLPVCGEPLEIIWNTWRYVLNLQQNYDGICQVYVLDDKKDLRVRSLAEKMKFNYITRESNELKKAGNLRNAFRQTRGEFIVIFDADFCPRADFLNQTLPYMTHEKDVAIVQTPQYFNPYDQPNDVAQGASGIQELFYRLVQVNRDSKSAPICVGTNAVYRRSALEPFGGTAPMPYSEDVHTGFQVTSAGLRVRYLPVNLAAGLCPHLWSAYFIQQYRWAMGSTNLFLSRKFWIAQITPWQRLCYLSGMLFYSVTGLSLILAPLPGLAILTFFPEKIFWWNLSFSLPSLIFSTGFMWAWMRSPFGLSTLEARQVSYFAHLFALIDLLRGRTEGWIPTGGLVRSTRYAVFRKVFTVYSIGLFAFIMLRSVSLITEGFPPETFALTALFASFNALISFRVIYRMWT